MTGRVQRLTQVLLLVICAQSCGRLRDEQPPAGVPVLTLLSPATLSVLRDSFNAAEDSVRILVMLSPT